MDNKPPKALDRRVQRTRQLLRDSLMALILERGYDAVTVQDITDRANLGRATFYLHYRDKDELLTASLKEIYDDLVHTIGPPDTVIEPTLSGRPFPALVVFQHAAQNRDLYRVMLSGQGAVALTRSVREYLVGVIVQRIQTQLAQDPPPIPTIIVAEHVAGSLLALVTWWLETESGYSVEEMAQYFRQLAVQSLLALSSLRVAKNENKQNEA